jgi:hypothetical protein
MNLPPNDLCFFVGFFVAYSNAADAERHQPPMSA